jgi:hypothetical protein
VLSQRVLRTRKRSRLFHHFCPVTRAEARRDLRARIGSFRDPRHRSATDCRTSAGMAHTPARARPPCRTVRRSSSGHLIVCGPTWRLATGLELPQPDPMRLQTRIFGSNP